jgi:hypothetical protein
MWFVNLEMAKAYRDQQITARKMMPKEYLPNIGVYAFREQVILWARDFLIKMGERLRKSIHPKVGMSTGCSS